MPAKAGIQFWVPAFAVDERNVVHARTRQFSFQTAGLANAPPPLLFDGAGAPVFPASAGTGPFSFPQKGNGAPGGARGLARPP
jgi:hypothetical protein